jgi:transposase-like protein
MDETYIKIKGHWYYLYRTMDKHEQTIDFLLTQQCDERAAKRFLSKGIRRHGVPETSKSCDPSPTTSPTLALLSYFSPKTFSRVESCHRPWPFTVRGAVFWGPVAL